MLNKARGFTLIELLVVIAIIALLSSVVLTSLSTARMKARDAKRQADIDQIHKAIELYADSTSTLPQPISYGELNSGGVDMSSQGDFMPFLVVGGVMSNVPVDPINNNKTDMISNISAGYSYGYYCYSPGQVGYTVDTYTLWYVSEVKNKLIRQDFPSPLPCK